MGAAKKIAFAAVIYAGYQLLTNKKYAGLRKQILSGYEEMQPTIVHTLDDIHTYLSVPKDVSDEATRIKIDDEIAQLKAKIKAIDSGKVAEKTNQMITNALDSTTKSINAIKRKK
ncbi:MAG: hypothetical protein LBT17_01700 [Mycoplasmataceae bacterium]|jgi:hypothetical protein|nr:hypothetical protein [Mycoplasmataceae bacterium]